MKTSLMLLYFAYFSEGCGNENKGDIKMSLNPLFYRTLFTMMKALVTRVASGQGIIPVFPGEKFVSSDPTGSKNYSNWFKGVGKAYSGGRSISSPRTIFHGRNFTSAPDNPSLFFNKLQNLNGGLQKLGMGTGTVTIPDLKTSMSEIFTNLDTTIQALPTDDEQPVFDDFRIQWRLYSSEPFTVMPWLFLTEAGETYTQSSTAESDLSMMAEAGVPAQNYSFQYGDLRVARPVLSDTVYETVITVDLTILANLYSDHITEKAFEEETPLVFKFGMLCFAKLRAGSALAISHQYISSIAYHMRKHGVF